MSMAEEAAEVISRHWRAGAQMADLPPQLKPATRAAGYAAQAALERAAPSARAGWKIAATSAAGQAHIGVDGPLAGRIFAGDVAEAGAAIPLSGNAMRVVEPEFAFRFATAVPAKAAPYSVEEALALVGDLHLSLEFPDSRFEDFAAVGGPALIADDACACQIVLGPPVANWREVDLAALPVHCRVGDRYTRQGIGANVLGDPRIALAWFLEEVGGLGVDIGAGEFVTTGTCAVPLEVEPGDQVRADYGPLGTIACAVV